MKLRSPLILVALILLCSVAVGFTAAQSAGCQDAAGAPCTATPPPAGGSDVDLDGVPDERDLCPTVGGDVSNAGCPAGSGQPTEPTTAPAVPPSFPDSPYCLVSPISENVNLRDMPSTNGNIVGMLLPGQFQVVVADVINGQGELWYMTMVGNYLRADTVVTNGNPKCATLPTVTIFPGAREIEIPADLLARPEPPAEAPPPPEPESCYYMVIIDGQAYCLVSIPPELTSGFPGTEGAPPPDPNDCVYWVVIEGQVVCLITEGLNDLTMAGGASEGAPPPEPESCFYWVVHNGQVYCLIPVEWDLTLNLNPAEGAPPPDPFAGCLYWVVIDGQAICLIPEWGDDLTLELDPQGAAPPPDDFDCTRWIVLDGQVICLVGQATDLTMAGGVSEGAPPPDPNDCNYWIVLNGQVVCLIGGAVNLTAGGNPSSQAGCVGDACNGGNSTAGGDPSEGAPPPDFDCARWIVIEGQVVCLMSEILPLAADDGAAESPMPQTREHILLARQVGTPAECPNLPDVSEGALVSPTAQIAMRDLVDLPDFVPCSLELMFPTRNPDGSMEGKLRPNSTIVIRVDVVVFSP